MGDALKKGDTDMNAEKRFAERMQELVYDCGLKPEEISALCGVGPVETALLAVAALRLSSLHAQSC